MEHTSDSQRKGLALDVDSERGVKRSVLLHQATHFAWLRTRLSAERTLMAFVRTSIALIGFGFTLFQFFEKFGRALGLERDRVPFAIWSMSLVLIAIGVISTALALYQYQGMLRYLWSHEFAGVAGTRRRRVVTAVPVTATLVGIAGIAALVAILVAR